MSTETTCPRCRAAVQASDRVCPRCGLVLNLNAPDAAQPRFSMLEAASAADTPAREPLLGASVSVQPAAVPALSPAPPASMSGAATNGNTGPLITSGSTGPLPALDTVGASENTGPLLHTGPLRTGPLNSSVLADSARPVVPPSGTGQVVPRGALELLPRESVAFQLGALYLTTKRVILLAPTVIRSAFIRDIDAVGTFTERASGWFLFGGVLFILLGAGAVYASVARSSLGLRDTFPLLYYVDPAFLGLLLAAAAMFMLVRYFFHVKRTLFVSVKGRPLITVSIADWNTRKLDGMDAFVNAFFQIKDLQTGELAQRTDTTR